MPPPAPLQCQVDGCQYATPANTPNWEMMCQLMQNHRQDRHGVVPVPAAAAGPAQHKPAPVPRPQIDLHSTEAEWKFFITEFDRYKRTVNLIEDQKVQDELWHCMTKQLKNLMQSTTLEDTNEQGLREKMYKLAVVTIHAAVHKSHLHSLQQTQTETFKEFVARVTNVASNCKLKKTCPADGCGTEVSFLDETVYDVALGGIKDPNIRQKIVTLCTMDTITNLQQLVTYVTAEENSLRETENFNVRNISVNAVRSTYKNNKFNRSSSSNKCYNCGGARHGDGSPAEKIKSCPAHGKVCSKCNKPNHFSRVCRSSQSKAAAVHDTAFIEQNEGDTETTAAPIMFFALEAMDPVTDLSQLKQLVSTFKASGDPVTSVVLPHSIHSVTDGWLQSRPQSSPTHSVTLIVDKSSYIQLGLNLPRPELANRTSSRVRANAVFDTGAQLNLCPLSILQQLNIQEQDLFKVSTNVSSAHNKKIQIAGGMILNVTAADNSTGKHFNSKQLFYVSPEVNDIYLSRNCCKDLQTIPDFIFRGAQRVQPPAPVMFNGKPLEYCQTVTHLGHEFHEKMDSDADRARGSFNRQTTDIRDQLHFSWLGTKCRAINLNACSACSLVLHELSSDATQKVFRAWNSQCKQARSIPASSHILLLEKYFCSDLISLRRQVYSVQPVSRFYQVNQ